MVEAKIVLLFLILGSTLAETAPHPIINIVVLVKLILLQKLLMVVNSRCYDFTVIMMDKYK